MPALAFSAACLRTLLPIPALCSPYEDRVPPHLVARHCRVGDASLVENTPRKTRPSPRPRKRSRMVEVTQGTVKCRLPAAQVLYDVEGAKDGRVLRRVQRNDK
jgi:hypothetical protein